MTVKARTFPEVQVEPTVKPELTDFLDEAPCWETSCTVGFKADSSLVIH